MDWLTVIRLTCLVITIACMIYCVSVEQQLRKINEKLSADHKAKTSSEDDVR